MIDLDEGVTEYLPFKVLGVEYRFKYPNTLEVNDMLETLGDRTRFIKNLSSLITPFDSKDPSFEEASKNMTIKHWQAFNKMIESIINGNGSN